ncbi:MAG: class I SAM-dependent methyltransferase [Candidatus Nanoarchaeia archaeon]
MKQIKAPSEWWHPSMNFFGKKAYLVGDNSEEGYLPGTKETIGMRTKREAMGALSLAELSKGSVLDVPCGYGRHSNLLAQQGYDVTGVDINKEHLEEAISKHSGARFLQRDMRKLGEDLYNKFDAVFNLTLSFGFFEKESDNIQTLSEFYKALKPGGKLVIHSDVSPEMIGGSNYQLREQRTLPDGMELIIEEEFDKSTSRLNGKWTLVGGESTKELTPYSVRIYTAQELEELCYEVGFKSSDCFGSFEGTPFNPESKEIIWLVEK